MGRHNDRSEYNTMISHSIHRRFDRIAGLTVFCYHFIFMIPQKLKHSHFVLYTTGKLRRYGLVHFRKGYVQNQLLVRGGGCRQCGVCCNLLFTCPMLTKNRLCLVYGTCRPQSCKVFPIDLRDIQGYVRISFRKICFGLERRITTQNA